MIKVFILAILTLILPIVVLGIAIYTADYKKVTIVLTTLTFIIPVEVTIFIIYLIIELFNLIY